MAVARKEVAPLVLGNAERVDLAVGVAFHVRTVGPHAIGVARAQADGGAIGRLDGGVVVEAVAGIDPAVEAPGKGVGHAVRVALAVLLVNFFFLVSLAVAVGVGQPPDVGDGVNKGLSGRKRQQADGDVQAFGENLALAGPAVGAEVAEDEHLVAAGLAGRGWERIFQA